MITAVSRARSTAQKIFDNIIFLGDIFGDRENEEVPDIPVLELAKSFELREFGSRAVALHGRIATGVGGEVQPPKA